LAKKKEKDAVVMDDELRKRSQWRDVWKRLRRNKMAMFAAFIVIAIILVVIFADYISPYPYDGVNARERLQFPSAQHWLGTDNMGRDLLARIIYGGRISLLVAVLSVGMSMIVGGFLGATAGYLGGLYESVVMRIMDVIMAVPGFLLAVSISAALGSGVFNTAVAIAISAVPGFTRIMRSTVLTLRDREFVEAAIATGSSRMRVIFYHILPNTLSQVIVQFTLRIGANILQISSLSFIGLGVQPPTPEWGSIMATGRQYIQEFYPLVVFPGIAIMITLFGFNILGDGLRDALDPRLKR